MSGSTEEFLTRVGNRVNGDAQTLADATDEAYRDNPLQALADLRYARFFITSMVIPYLRGQCKGKCPN